MANGKLLKEKYLKIFGFSQLQVMLEGIEAALSIWHLYYGEPRNSNEVSDSMSGSYLGPEFSESVIKLELDRCGAVYKKLSTRDLIDRVSEALTLGKPLAG